MPQSVTKSPSESQRKGPDNRSYTTKVLGRLAPLFAGFKGSGFLSLVSPIFYDDQSK